MPLATGKNWPLRDYKCAQLNVDLKIGRCAHLNGDLTIDM